MFAMRVLVVQAVIVGSLLLSATAFGAVDLTKTCECRPRGGVPNALAKLKAGEASIEIEVVVDGGKPLVYRRARTPESRIYSRFVYLPEYAWGEHEAVFTVKKVPSGQRCILGQFLIVGRHVAE